MLLLCFLIITYHLRKELSTHNTVTQSLIRHLIRNDKTEETSNIYFSCLYKTTVMDHDQLLTSIYTDIKHPASFGSAANLYKAAKVKDKTITNTIVKKWLQSNHAYTLHKPLKRRFLRRKTIAPGLYHQLQIDLVDVANIRTKNKNVRFLLTAIDIFNRKAFAIPLKTKRGTDVVVALANIFSQYPYVKFIQADQGKEFFNSHVLEYLKQKGIKLFYTSSDTKSAIVERFNRTLKERMYRYFTNYNTKSYLPILDQLIDSYNNTKHSAIGIAPNQVSKRNEKLVWDFQYKKYIQKYGSKPFTYKIGDVVRISKVKKEFRKGYLPKFVEEYFKIHDRLSTFPPTYKLIDINGEIIKGSFYAAEIQLVVPKPGEYRIVKSRKKKGRKEYLIHFIGQPSNLDTWMNLSTLSQYSASS